MARQRIHPKENRGAANREHKKYPPRPPQTTRPDKWSNKVAMFIAFNIVIVILSVVYLFYQHYLENIVITPLHLPKVVVNSGLDVPSRFWGTYRPGTYFGMRTRSPSTLITGIMWFTQMMHNNKLDIRHSCDQWSDLEYYTWLQHDGENFGVQRIVEKEFSIVTSFVKQAGGRHGGDFTVNVSFKPRKNQPALPAVSFLFYAYSTSLASDLISDITNESHLKSIRGTIETLGNFTLHFRERETSKTIFKYNYLVTEAHSITNLKELVMRYHALFQSKEYGQLQILGLIGHASPISKEIKRTNFVVYEVTFVPPFEMDISFDSGSFTKKPAKLVGKFYDSELNRHMMNFEQKFENIFKLQKKNYSKEDIGAARAALSNMIGGIGYFYGASLVQSEYNKEPLSYWNAPLYTAVPSRSFFPRGFLWDEGFHNLLILQWNPEITKDILGHWLDLMNREGWIPREQILGAESKERVPPEFIVQKDKNANPPAFFLTLEMLLQKMKVDESLKDVAYLKSVLPRLKIWFDWFNKTQNGMISGSYRWRGRDPKTNLELNPKTLTSGLDDYPRATHPTIDERHVDLRCWIAFSAGILADIADFVGDPLPKYRETHLYLTDNNLLDKLHWSSTSESYSDYGFHSRSVKLTQQPIPPPPGSKQPPKTITFRTVVEEPVLRFVDNFGYVSLFPFLLKIINPDNPKLNTILADLKNPNLLWTDYGLRSLAKTSSYYMKYNTQNDPPYWRGTIWININYLAVRALHFYGNKEGPYREQALQLYAQLRENIVTNILKEYKRTGFIWEQYDDKTGKGKGAHPFTGWSALFVLMMGELY